LTNFGDERLLTADVRLVLVLSEMVRVLVERVCAAKDYHWALPCRDTLVKCETDSEAQFESGKLFVNLMVTWGLLFGEVGVRAVLSKLVEKSTSEDLSGEISESVYDLVYEVARFINRGDWHGSHWDGRFLIKELEDGDLVEVQTSLVVLEDLDKVSSVSEIESLESSESVVGDESGESSEGVGSEFVPDNESDGGERREFTIMLGEKFGGSYSSALKDEYLNVIRRWVSQLLSVAKGDDDYHIPYRLDKILDYIGDVVSLKRFVEIVRGPSDEFERGCRPSEWEGFPGIVGTAKERLGARLFKDVVRVALKCIELELVSGLIANKGLLDSLYQETLMLRHGDVRLVEMFLEYDYIRLNELCAFVFDRSLLEGAWLRKGGGVRLFGMKTVSVWRCWGLLLMKGRWGGLLTLKNLIVHSWILMRGLVMSRFCRCGVRY